LEICIRAGVGKQAKYSKDPRFHQARLVSYPIHATVGEDHFNVMHFAP